MKTTVFFRIALLRRFRLSDVLTKFPKARFTIVGSGPEETRLKADALAWKIRDSVDFISWLPQSNLFELYDSHDLLLFPSLHDSSGGVVLEALCHGMPVVCLDLGGPKDIVTVNSGVIIRTDDQNTAQVAAKMAVEISRLLASPETLAVLSAGAVCRAREFILAKRIDDFYNCAMNFITLNRTEPTAACLPQR